MAEALSYRSSPYRWKGRNSGAPSVLLGLAIAVSYIFKSRLDPLARSRFRRRAGRRALNAADQTEAAGVPQVQATIPIGPLVHRGMYKFNI